MTKTTSANTPEGLGDLIQKLVQYNIWVYHPPGANPTNGDVVKYKQSIKETVIEINNLETP